MITETDQADTILRLRRALYATARKYDDHYDACTEAIKALARLVDAKDEKDANGETERYHLLKVGAWDDARAALKRLRER